MRDYEKEFTDRVAFIRQLLAESGAAGIVYGNSGGKDSALVGILCKAACENTVGLLLPCTSKRNYAEDRADAETVAAQYRIETRTVDLTPVKAAALAALDGVTTPNAPALANLAPRLRMLTLYAVAASENRLAPAPATAARRMSAISRNGATARMTSIPSPTLPSRKSTNSCVI